MGCTSSKQAAPLAKPPRAVSERPNPAAVTSAPSASYDVASSASLSVATGTAPVAFYGLLAPGGGDRLSLGLRVSEAAPERRRTRPACGGDGADCTGGETLLRGVAMTMPWTVICGKSMEEKAVTELNAVVKTVFDAVNVAVNSWNPESAISELNKASPGKHVALPEAAQRLFDAIDVLFDVTGGRYDPTASVLTLAWAKEITERGRPPLDGDVAHLRYAVGWRRVKRKQGKAARSNANTVVDVDGAAKGIAVDMIFEAVREVVGEDVGVCVDWAGDIRAWGKHPHDRPWRTAVVRPPGLQNLFKVWAEDKLHACLDGAKATHVVDMVAPGEGDQESQDVARPAIGLSASGKCVHPEGQGVAMATSGDYFHMQKFGFHHIADPIGMGVMKAGAKSIASASVMARNCVLADGLATAAMTFTTAPEADEFLASIVRTMPREVFGYCLVARTPEHGTEVLASPYFLRASAASSAMIYREKAAVAAEGGLCEERKDIILPEDAGRLPSSEMTTLLDCFPRIMCFLSFPDSPGAGAQVDSLQSLSMNPEPYVSFTVRNSLLATKDLRAFRGLISFTVGSENLSAGPQPASFQVQVMRLLRVNADVSVAIAAVCGTDQGNAQSIGLNYRSQAVSFGITRPVETSAFARMTLLDQVKAVLRRIPGFVWVVTTEAAHGPRHALTASSVASSSLAPDILTFNVMETNMFTAAFRGAGSTVEVFAVGQSQEHLASEFVTKTTMTDGDHEGLRVGAALRMTVSVAHVTVVKDHMLVVGRVTSAVQPASGEGEKSPLVWLDKKYKRLKVS